MVRASAGLRSKRVRDGAIVRETVKNGIELAAGGGIAFAAEGERALADALDRGEDRLALLLADGAAEHASDQPDILAQRPPARMTMYFGA